jgi:Trypsin-like peptidase domain/Colicin V production protein
VANGFSRGFWLSLAQYLGLLIGVVIGAAAAQPLLDHLGINNPVARPLGAVLVLIIGGSLGSSVGFAAGQPIRHRILKERVHTATDSIAGAALSAIAVLAMCWFLGITFSRGPSPELAYQLQRSTVLHALDYVAPRPPGFLARVESILAGVSFPPVFAGLEPTLPGALPTPTTVNTVGVQHAAAVTVKVISTGCGGLVTGSGFPIGNGLIVTNAHVVSGTNDHRIQTADGTVLPASVVYFDPEVDIAILRVPGYVGPSLEFAPAGRGTAGAVIGYPGGGPERVEPAVIDGAVNAEGRDIYSANLVTRQIYVLQSRVRPGNSGGPIVDLQGRVLGVVFATSATQPDQAYALTDDQIAGDIAQGKQSHNQVNTMQYACAA